MKQTEKELTFVPSSLQSGWFRLVFFCAGVGFTYLALTREVRNESGEPISEMAKWALVLLFFPAFWGMAFIPWTQIRRVRVTAQGICADISRSTTMFHPSKESEFRATADKVQQVAVIQDQESPTMWSASVEFKWKVGGRTGIDLPGPTDEASVKESAQKVAELLRCPVAIK